MTDFRFHYPVQVRYADLDPQWHVNNARYLTYLEMARSAYLKHLGLWDGTSFFDIGLIVGDIHIRYLAPVKLGDPVQVDMSVTRIGNKSLTMTYQIVHQETAQVMAVAESIMIAFDYHIDTSVPVSAAWRKTISEFEGQDFLLRE